MNWYNRHFKGASDYLIDWIITGEVTAGFIKLADIGETKFQIPDDEAARVVEMFDAGLSPQNIRRETGFDGNTIRRILLRTNRIQPGSLGASKGGGTVNDPVFIDKVKKLRDEGYNKSQIAKELDVSTQTVDRTIAFHDWRTPKDMLSYVSYQFWHTYHSGIGSFLDRLHENERGEFISNFVDKLFKKPADRDLVKEALFQKLKIRSKLYSRVDPENPAARPPLPQLLERGEPTLPQDVGSERKTDWRQSIPANIPPGQSTQYQRRLRMEENAGEIENEKKSIVSRYMRGEEIPDLAREYGVDFATMKNFIDKALAQYNTAA